MNVPIEDDEWATGIGVVPHEGGAMPSDEEVALRDATLKDLERPRKRLRGYKGNPYKILHVDRLKDSQIHAYIHDETRERDLIQDVYFVLSYSRARLLARLILAIVDDFDDGE